LGLLLIGQVEVLNPLHYEGTCSRPIWLVISGQTDRWISRDRRHQSHHDHSTPHVGLLEMGQNVASPLIALAGQYPNGPGTPPLIRNSSLVNWDCSARPHSGSRWTRNPSRT